MAQQPDIYDFLDYRAYLKEYYDFKKSQGRGFSYRSFARRAGFKSTNYYKLIVDGKRGLSDSGLLKFAKAIGFSKTEINYFETLVKYNQSKDLNDQEYFLKRLIQNKNFESSHQLEASQYKYFTHWHTVAIREMVMMHNFKEDPEWICLKLKKKVSPDEIKRSIQLLLDLGLLIRDENNRLKQHDSKIKTELNIMNLAVLGFHKTMLDKAKESLTTSATKHRDVSALTVALDEKTYKHIQERVNQFRKEIHALTEQCEKPDTIYQINFQLFDLTEVKW